MKRALFMILGATLLVVLYMSSIAQAITWGEEDLGGEYPNVVSVRGIVESNNTARLSCSGSLLHIDADKVVILTAAHCTDVWIAGIAAGIIDSVGVSFDQNNVIGTSYSDATYYVRGGVPISYPEKDSPFEKLDYGMVVFPIDAENSLGETIDDRWGSIPDALTPVEVSPDPEYLPDLINSVRNATKTLSFTAVGYGTGEKFPIPGEETGPANPSGVNYDTFPIRYIADSLSYNAHNPVNDVLRLSMNIAKEENGTCNGDSGGPIFFYDEELDQVFQVSLVSGGDMPCRATNTGPGFSRQEAFDFIGCADETGDTNAVISCVNGLFD